VSEIEYELEGRQGKAYVTFKDLNCNGNEGSRDSLVGIATGYWLDEQGGGEVRVPVG
jgi:hypothetical protein